MKVLCIDTAINIRRLSRQILKNEPKILKKYPYLRDDYTGLYDDGGTNLGKNSLTSRYYYFNVLHWWGTRLLRKNIRRGYETYTDIKNTPLYVQCWANVMRKGDQVKRHSHAPDGVSVVDSLSGNLNVKVDGLTSTYYDGYPILNEPGQMTFFPGSLYHWTDKYMGDDERITVAFDIMSETTWDYSCNHLWDKEKLPYIRSHWIKL